MSILTALVPKESVVLPVTSINTWQRRLEHDNRTMIRRIRDIADSGVEFFYSLLDCSTRKMGEKLRNPTPNVQAMTGLPNPF